MRRTRRSGGKGVIEKVPETPVKGTKKRAVHTPEAPVKASTVKEAAKADKHEHNV